jgi:iron(III) transport system permease protein
MANASGVRGRFEDYALLWGLLGVVAVLSVLPLGALPARRRPAGRRGVRRCGFAACCRAARPGQATGHSLVTALGSGRRSPVVLGGVVALTVSLHRYQRPQRLRLLLRDAVDAGAAGRGAGVAADVRAVEPVSSSCWAVAPALGSRNPLYSPGGIILVLGVQYAPLVFLTLRAGLRTLPQELLEAALAGGAKPLRVIRTIVLPLMTPPLLAGVALSFVSCLGNFGIPCAPRHPGQLSRVADLIYQRLAGFGPSVLSEVAVLSVLIGMIAIVGIVAQDVLLSRRDFRTASAAVEARAFELRRWRRPVEIALWALSFLALVPPFTALLADVAGSGRGRAARRGERDDSRTTASCCSSTRPHGVRSGNSFGLSAAAAVTIVLIAVPLAYFVVWRRSRLLRAVNVVTECHTPCRAWCWRSPRSSCS